MSTVSSAAVYTQGFGSAPLGNLGILPFVAGYAPNANNVTGPNGQFKIGQIWVDTSSNVGYILTGISYIGTQPNAHWAQMTSSSSTISAVHGTANEITVTTTSGVATASFPSTVDFPGTVTVADLFTCDTSATIHTGGTALQLATDNDPLGVNIGLGTLARTIDIGYESSPAPGAVRTINIGNSNSSSTLHLYGPSGISMENDIAVTGNISLSGSVALTVDGGKIFVAAGNASLDSVGTAILSLGTVTVSTSAVTADSLIFLSYNNCTSALACSLDAPSGSIVAGTSFVINSQDTTDSSSTVNYWIIN